MIRLKHKYSLEKIYNESKNNSVQLSTMNKKTTLIHESNFLKKSNRIVLIDGVELVSDEEYHLSFEIDDFPEYMLPYVTLVANCRTGDDSSINLDDDDQRVYTEISSQWQPSSFDSDKYTMYVDGYFRFTEKEVVALGYTYVARPFYVDLYLNITNKRVLNELQKRKK